MKDLLKPYDIDGFFFKARSMQFDAALGEKLIVDLAQAEREIENLEDRMSLVRQVWKMPFSLAMYRERCISNGADERQFDETLRKAYEAVNRIVQGS